MYTQLSYERYGRQMVLKELGEAGQQKLSAASVVVVGAGGLGCPALQYLVAAGVGRIGVVDDDVVALHNLHRQVLYTTEDVGQPKVQVAAARLRQSNPDVTIESHYSRLTTHNALEILGGYEIVLDATDNFASRYLINDACVLLNKTLVYGAVSQFEGQVAIFNATGVDGAVNYRDLFPQPPPPGTVLNCAEAGVLGVLPGIIGTMQAAEVMKLITGIGQPLINQLFTYNALTVQSFVFLLSKNAAAETLLPKSKEAFEQNDYDGQCNTTIPADEIDADTFSGWLGRQDVCLIDVREKGEQPSVTEFTHRQMPLSTFADHDTFISQEVVVVFCQSGQRSQKAAGLLAAAFGASKKIYSLRGGILQWKAAHGKEA